MRICFFSPYIPEHFGGGEKYTLSCCESLSKKHSVYLAIPGQKKFSESRKNNIRDQYRKRLSVDLSNVKIISTPLYTRSSFIKKILWTKQFDRLCYVTDGSLFYSLAKKNILHIQVPFTNKHEGFLKRLKLNSWHVKTTYSIFAKKVIEKNWITKVNFVHYPTTVDFSKVAKPFPKKKKIILSVGRIFKQLHNKRHDVSIKFFKSLCDKYPKIMKDWQLIIVGFVEDKKYFNELRKMSKGYRIVFFNDISSNKLQKIYKESSIYWHATGYGIDQKKEPQKAEHFGMTTVEAMTHGCVPVVINKGGQKEILSPNFKELLWETEKECEMATKKLITNKEYFQRQQKKIYEILPRFSNKVFEKKLGLIFK